MDNTIIPAEIDYVEIDDAEIDEKIISLNLWNFAEAPITQLSKNPLSVKNNTIKQTIKVLNPITKELHEGTLIIEGNPKYGILVSVDDDVLMTLLSISLEQGFKDTAIYTNYYILLNRLEWGNAGKDYKRLKDSLKRLSTVRIINSHFWVIDQFHSTDMGIIQTNTLDKFEEEGYDENHIPKTYVRLNQDFFEEIKRNYSNHIDLQVYLSIKSAGAKRIFKWLDKKFSIKDNSEITCSFEDIVKHLLNISPKTRTNKLKIYLKKYNKELIVKNIIKDENDLFFKKNKNWYVKYQRGILYNNSGKKENNIPDWNIKQINLFDKLKNFGLSEKEKIDIITKENDFPLYVATNNQWLQRINKYADFLLLKIEIKGHSFFRSKRNYFNDMIKKGYDISDELLELQKEKEKIKKEIEKSLSQIKKVKENPKIISTLDENEKENAELLNRIKSIHTEWRSKFIQELKDELKKCSKIVQDLYFYNLDFKSLQNKFTFIKMSLKNEDTFMEILSKYTPKYKNIIPDHKIQNEFTFEKNN